MFLLAKLFVERPRFRCINQAVATAVILFGGLMPSLHAAELLELSKIPFAEDEIVSHAGTGRWQNLSPQEEREPKQNSGQVHRGLNLAHTFPPFSASGHCFPNGLRLPLLC